MNIRLSLAQTNIVFLFTFSLGFKVLELLIFLLSFLSGFDNGSTPKNYKAKQKLTGLKENFTSQQLIAF